MLWETIKLQCRGSSIQYSSFKKRNRKNKIRSLEEEIKKLEENINGNPQGDNSMQNRERLIKAKEELDEEVEEETRGYIIRSKATWYEEGEKSNKFFLNLEKRNHNQKKITKLKLENGTCTLQLINQQFWKNNMNFIPTFTHQEVWRQH